MPGRVTTEQVQRELGQIEADLKNLKDQFDKMTHGFDRMASDVEAIKEQFVAIRGGWKLLLILASVGATLGGFLTRWF